MKELALLLSLALLAVPVAAQAPGEHVLQYRGFILTDQSNDGIVAETTVSVESRHTWTGGNGTSMLEVRISLVTQSGALTSPEAEFQVHWDGAPVTDCMWVIESGTISGGRFNPSISLYCALPSFAQPGNHTIEVERTSVTETPITNAVTSIILHQTETVQMELNVNTEADFFLPFLFWGGLTLFFLAQRSFAPAIASSIMVLSALLQAPVWSAALGIMLILITLWIESIGKRGVFKGAEE